MAADTPNKETCIRQTIKRAGIIIYALIITYIITNAIVGGLIDSGNHKNGGHIYYMANIYYVIFKR